MPVPAPHAAGAAAAAAPPRRGPRPARPPAFDLPELVPNCPHCGTSMYADSPPAWRSLDGCVPERRAPPDDDVEGPAAEADLDPFREWRMAATNVPPITARGVAVWGTTAINARGATNTAAAVASNGVSAVVDTMDAPFVSAFGHASGATTIVIQYSADGINFYTAHSVVLAGAAGFAIDCICGAEFVRLQTSAAVSIWATIQAKDGG
jgi:hypothetical protein